ncbi:MAG: histidine--tRNA ligase [Ignavibacteria bacterium]|jgi:histidyl-tRNA synthetase|nr:histidine--tRNA ligase [Ignavibacteria bacterium]
MNAIQSIRGTKDILPNESHKWQILEATAREISSSFGYRELRTPIFEKTEVFSRGVGDGTDIVNKEMYTFNDKGNESLTLRPEQTAALVRSVIQNNLLQENPVTRLYYIGQYFRYERPQKGRLRQFHQFGIECINSPYPESDAEVIMLAINFIKRLKINDYRLLLNSIGNEESRKNYKTALVAFLTANKDGLSEDSRNRLDINPLRILDSKATNDIDIVKNAPIILDFLDEESQLHFNTVKSLLDSVGIKYDINPLLVRGLDYYSHTVFEFQSTHLGSQDAFGGGGRYNGLFTELGGKDTPAVGFAMGMERLLLILEQLNGDMNKQYQVDAMVIPTDAKHIELAMQVHNLLVDSHTCIVELNRRSLKAQLREANKLGVRYALIIGDDEANKNAVTIKYMAEEKEQKLIQINDLLNNLE